MSDHSSASSLALMLVEDKIRKGAVIQFPSIGVILTSVVLEDKTNASPPTRTEVITALQDCLLVQELKLSEASSQEERAIIEMTISRLKKEIQEPSKYLW